MENQETVQKLDDIAKSLSKIAEAMSVFKVMAMAFLLAFLIITVKNFLP